MTDRHPDTDRLVALQSALRRIIEVAYSPDIEIPESIEEIHAIARAALAGASLPAVPEAPTLCDECGHRHYTPATEVDAMCECHVGHGIPGHHWDAEIGMLVRDKWYEVPASVPVAVTPDLRAAAQAADEAWERYIEAHANRGHDGPHEPDPHLDGDCGPCTSAQYGTEVEMDEYVMPALRAALAGAASSPALDATYRVIDLFDELGLVHKVEYENLSDAIGELRLILRARLATPPTDDTP